MKKMCKNVLLITDLKQDILSKVVKWVLFLQ